MNAGGVLIPDEEGGEGQVDMTPSTVKNTSAKDHHVMVVNGTQRQHKREEGDGGFMSIITWYTGSDLLYRKPIDSAA